MFYKMKDVKPLEKYKLLEPMGKKIIIVDDQTYNLKSCKIQLLIQRVFISLKACLMLVALNGLFYFLALSGTYPA